MRRGFVRESEGWKSPIGILGQSPGRKSGGQVIQKPVIFCKLYYSDVTQRTPLDPPLISIHETKRMYFKIIQSVKYRSQQFSPSESSQCSLKTKAAEKVYSRKTEPVDSLCSTF